MPMAVLLRYCIAANHAAQSIFVLSAGGKLCRQSRRAGLIMILTYIVINAGHYF